MILSRMYLAKKSINWKYSCGAIAINGYKRYNNYIGLLLR